MTCSHKDCKLDAHCEHCGGACILHCVGITTWWAAFWYFFREWRRYVRERLS